MKRLSSATLAFLLASQILLPMIIDSSSVRASARSVPYIEDLGFYSQPGIQFKFHDYISVLLKGDRLYSATGIEYSEISETLSKYSASNLQRLFYEHSIEDLDFWRERGVQRTGKSLPNLNNWFTCTFPSITLARQAAFNLTNLPYFSSATLIPLPAMDDLPPVAVDDLTIQISSSSIELSWSPPEQDTGGNPITIIEYNVYASSVPYFALDPATLVATVENPFFTETIVEQDPSRRFYCITAFGMDSSPDVEDIPPLTSDFSSQQEYHENPPWGVGIDAAWGFPNGHGGGIQLCHVEGGWVLDHEDLSCTYASGGNSNDYSWMMHGTACSTIMAAPNNGYGVIGIAYGIDRIYVRGIFDGGSPNAWITAFSLLDEGDVIEASWGYTGGELPPGYDCCGSSPGKQPAESNQADFDAIQTITANGVIVVCSASNGCVPMDHSFYNGIYNLEQRDSGALLIGAILPGGEPCCFTNYGSRVDAHAWGSQVCTAGYGDLFEPNDDDRQSYTNNFGGTSSAAPIVAGCIAAIQGIYKDRFGGQVLDPWQFREILRTTGTPQSSDQTTRPIGNMPDIDEILSKYVMGLTQVPSGTFLMGSNDGYPDEQPPHQVTISSDFYISTHEVTNAQYCQALQWAYDNSLVVIEDNTVIAYNKALLQMFSPWCEIAFDGNSFFIRESPSDIAQSAYPNGYSPSDHPVKEVTWFGAACYCDWISLMTNVAPFYNGSWDQTETHNPYLSSAYRLPTEAEWEYAAQYNDDRNFPWGGDTPNCSFSNFNGCIGWTTQVGNYPYGVTQLGLLDMAGSIREWCGDWIDCNYYETSPSIDPLGPPDPIPSYNSRIVRGGDYEHPAVYLRCSTRDWYPVTDGGWSFRRIGFRICRTANP